VSGLQDYLRFFVTLTAVLDPFLAIPIFLTVTSDPGRRARLALVVSITVFAVLVGSIVFGEALLKLIGASIPAFQVGGGLVLLLMALSMLNAQAGSMRQSSAEAAELESGEQFGVVPLAVPLLAGPGAISTAIIAAQPGGAAHATALIGCVALVCLLLWGVLRLADAVGPRMGRTGLNIITRLLGLLLAAIAIQTMAEGLRVLFPGLSSP
jgi:multiple antibiotic resistance protein